MWGRSAGGEELSHAQTRVPGEVFFCQSVSPLSGAEPCLLNLLQGRLGSVSTDVCSSRGKDALRCLRQRSWGRGIVGIVVESWQ